MIGGPSYEVKLGRKDGFESKAHKVKGNLPTTDQNVQDQLSIYQKNGFTLREMVALSRGHTVGVSQCIKFSKRVFGLQADPELDGRFADVLKDICNNYKKNKTAMTFLDPVMPSKFDNVYFKNLKRGLGLLASDHILFKDKSTRPFVEIYANDQKVFFYDFARAMEKLGTVGVKSDKNWEVRRICDQINNPKV